MALTERQVGAPIAYSGDADDWPVAATPRDHSTMMKSMGVDLAQSWSISLTLTEYNETCRSGILAILAQHASDWCDVKIIGANIA
jgi:hypothetical protein